MLQVYVSLVLILACPSICFGASLREPSVKPSPISELSLSIEQQSSCQPFLDEYHGLDAKEVAKILYKQAFVLSFDSDWEAAKKASTCSSLLLNGSSHWRIEALSLVH